MGTQSRRCRSGISGIDIALWDIIGKSCGKPIHKLIGGAQRSEVTAYATGLYFSPSHALMLCLTILIAGGVVALMWRFKHHATRPVAVPYGVAIALGTAWHVGRQAVL
ncbi:MAG: hypothetical protein RJA29_1588 [Pseudomonadota bacterium]